MSQAPDAEVVETVNYYDPNATNASWPGIIGLQMNRTTYRQADGTMFDMYVALGPAPDSKDLQPVNVVSGPSRSGQILAPIFISQQPGLCTGPFMGTAPEGTYFGINALLEGCWGGDLYFPVLPQDAISPEYPANENWRPRALGIGELLIPGNETLEGLSWTSFFPRFYDEGFCVVPERLCPEPLDAVTRLIWTKRMGLECRLVVGGTNWNEDVIVESFTPHYKAGEPDDIYYDIVFKRYRYPIIYTVRNPDAPTDPRDDPGFAIPLHQPIPLVPADRDDRNNPADVAAQVAANRPALPTAPDQVDANNRALGIVAQHTAHTSYTTTYKWEFGFLNSNTGQSWRDIAAIVNMTVQDLIAMNVGLSYDETILVPTNLQSFAHTEKRTLFIGAGEDPDRVIPVGITVKTAPYFTVKDFQSDPQFQVTSSAGRAAHDAAVAQNPNAPRTAQEAADAANRKLRGQ